MTSRELKAQLRSERLSARDAIPAEKRASKSLAKPTASPAWSAIA
ncbi:5-formyltetrahydrofolate cyclo-ligase, partial [Rhizobium leguminosarum]